MEARAGGNMAEAMAAAKAKRDETKKLRYIIDFNLHYSYPVPSVLVTYDSINHYGLRQCRETGSKRPQPSGKKSDKMKNNGGGAIF